MATRSGYVLTGGRSSRFGTDKALAPVRGQHMAVHIAERIRPACHQVSLVGDAQTHDGLGLPVIGDTVMDFGPVAGIHAALECTSAEWNLIVACDMPNVTSDFVDWLLRRAEAGTADAVIPVDEEGRRHPLCAVYRKALAARLQMAIERGMRKVMLAFDGVSVDYAPAEEFREFGSSQVLLLNVNRPEDLARYR